jgi:hypothetical protein
MDVSWLALLGELLVVGADMPARSAGDWLGLYERAGAFELRLTSIARGTDIHNDRRRDVVRASAGTPILLLRRLTAVRPGSVVAARPWSKDALVVDEAVVFTLGGVRTSVWVTKTGDVLLDSGGTRQVLRRATDDLANSPPAIRWAGDLDRDEHLDLALTLYDQRRSRFVELLLLSSVAPPGRLVGEAARLELKDER